jgi:hypothetical protein
VGDAVKRLLLAALAVLILVSALYAAR